MDWVTIPEFPKYSVNQQGVVIHTKFEREVEPQVNQLGVPYICVYDDYGIQRKRSLALLVARAFIKSSHSHFDTPINLDGNRLRCEVSNIVWRPRWFAIQYVRQFKDPYDRPIPAPIKDLKHGKVYPGSYSVFTTNGLLERDLVLSIENRTYVWPTYQLFGFA